jgi:hypothetical protein
MSPRSFVAYKASVRLEFFKVVFIVRESRFHRIFVGSQPCFNTFFMFYPLRDEGIDSYDVIEV